MNQILLTNELNNKKSKGSKGNNNGGNPPDKKKILLFFGIAILVFAVLIIGIGISKLSKNKKGKDEEVVIPKPQVSLEKVEEENQVKIIANAQAGISKIIYSWNDEASQEEDQNGIKDYEEILEIPEGENTLNVKVIDMNNQEIETSEDFVIEEDPEKAKIEIDESVGHGKVKITATDELNKMKVLKYRWNDGEDKEIKATTDEQTIIETTINVKRGENTLIITAINGNDKEKIVERLFKGVNKPIIEVEKNGNKLVMKVTHDMGFEKVVFNVNGQEYIYDENYPRYNSSQKELAYSFDMKEGENIVIIDAISNEKVEDATGSNGTEEIYRGKCNYTAR